MKIPLNQCKQSWVEMQYWFIYLCCSRTSWGFSCFQGDPRDVSILGAWDIQKIALWQHFKTEGICLSLQPSPDFCSWLFLVFVYIAFVDSHNIAMDTAFWCPEAILKFVILEEVKFSIFTVKIHMTLKWFRHERFFFLLFFCCCWHYVTGGF